MRKKVLLVGGDDLLSPKILGALLEGRHEKVVSDIYPDMLNIVLESVPVKPPKLPKPQFSDPRLLRNKFVFPRNFLKRR